MMRQYIEDSSLTNKFQPVDKNAVPTIGPYDFVQKINNSYRFPNDAVDHKVEGYVEVRFYVDEKGNAMDYKIVQDLGYGTGPELVKRLNTHESWFPAKYKGKDIGVWINYVLYLNFRDLTIN
ncbi:energy transducer TonB [Sphingobacterium sp.]|uniref:energy transducer TonB n=1 Tax=Sphingobacterium sp. TaxID=341027 RepID=UPI0028A9264A|nr:energy transducer TonB [Sphingobacterium sp.]